MLKRMALVLAVFGHRTKFIIEYLTQYWAKGDLHQIKLIKISTFGAR